MIAIVRESDIFADHPVKHLQASGYVNFKTLPTYDDTNGIGLPDDKARQIQPPEHAGAARFATEQFRRPGADWRRPLRLTCSSDHALRPI